MKKNIIAGLVLTCLGDEGCFSYLSRDHSKSMIEETVEYAFNHYTDKPIKIVSMLLPSLNTLDFLLIIKPNEAKINIEEIK